MKPIKLRIKGLNSFIEEQTIDFERLTDRGLFGIIGPTGSGKSTVLDGITLALYGEVARKSSNFINTNCDSAQVSFIFQISGAETKRYQVEREFKTDKKSGNPRSGKCKVIEITGEEPVVLADSVSGVTNVCKEVIGLTLEDFTRTVVLPQGKFSDFLKLAGKERRDMLERLFNLQKYGDELSKKLAKEVAAEKSNYSFLMGGFAGYEEVNEANKKQLEEELTACSNQLNQLQTELQEIEKEFVEKQEIWKLQMELSQHKQVQTELLQKEESMNLLAEQLAFAQAAEKVLPYLEAYEATVQALIEQEKRAAELAQKLAALQLERERISQAYQAAQEKKDKQMPSLQLQEASGKEALAEQNVVEELRNVIRELETNCIQLQEKKEGLTVAVESQKQEIEKLNEQIREAEQQSEQCKVPIEKREQVQEGIRLVEKLHELKRFLEAAKEKFEESKTELETETKHKEQLEEQLSEQKAMEIRVKSEMEQLIADCPGEAKDLLQMQQQLAQSKEYWAKVQTATNIIAQAKKEKEENARTRAETEKELGEMNQQLAELLQQKKKIEVEQLAHTLRANLIEGECCPVCGAKEHQVENVVFVEAVEPEELEEAIQSTEQRRKEVESQNLRAQTREEAAIQKLEEAEKEIEQLDHSLKESTVEELEERFEKRQKAIEEYEKKKDALEKQSRANEQNIAMVTEQVKSSKVIIEKNEKLRNQLREEYRCNYEMYQTNRENYHNLQKESNIQSFKEEYQAITKMEQEREALLQRIKEQRQRLEQKQNEQKERETELTALLEDIARTTTGMLERQKNKEERERSIRAKVGEVTDIAAYVEEIQRELASIQKEYEQAEKEKETVELQFQKDREQSITIASTLSELTKRKEKEAVTLNEKLQEQNFTSSEEVKEKQLSNSEMAAKQELLANYQEKVAKNQGALAAVGEKLGGRQVEEAQWQEIGRVRSEKLEEVAQCTEVKIQAETKLNQMLEKMQKLSDLITKKEKLDHKLGLLDVLEKLFKGKKFVEYVAATRLKYISIEASKKLKEISNGTYGLEVDENGKFIIRDYKNGGAARDASTLSGGETFITSLALALALSAEIQLKGTAPLELFFLDEGFGTLDDNLLDVVMGAIEQIHNDKLKVGLISHVESIKNRVPVKLVLTPAKAGEGGSKVTIERS